MPESVSELWAHDAHDRKRVYVTPQSAQRAARSINEAAKSKAVVYYGCRHCGFFHVGQKR